MKRIIILIIFAFNFLLSYSQRQICGVYFGTGYNNAKIALEQKFGACDRLSDENELVFRYKQYAGIRFDYLSFSFQRDNNYSYLNQCVMGIDCKTIEEAKRNRDYIAHVVSSQYALNTATDKDGFKYYYGGTSPTNYSDFAFCIDVVKLTESSNGGYKYFARIIYGPFTFVKEEF